MPKTRIPKTKRGTIKQAREAARFDSLSARMAFLDKVHDASDKRVAELGRMNEKLLHAIDGWRRTCDAQAAELKALRMVAYIADDPKTVLGQLRAEVAEYRTGCAEAEHVNILREQQIMEMKRMHAEELHSLLVTHQKQIDVLNQRIEQLTKKKKKAPETPTATQPANSEFDERMEVALIVPPFVPDPPTIENTPRKWWQRRKKEGE